MKMFEVFYNGVKIGLVRATDKTVAREAINLAGICAQSPTGALYGQVIDTSLITYNDNNQRKYAHMM